MKRFIFTTIALCLTLAAGAQVIPVNPKFGAVSEEEVAMTVYEPDTSAVAVMLYREYDLDLVFNARLEIVKMITVHERIKILKEEGKKYADYSFLYYNSTAVRENYSGVKVETFNLEDGKLVRTKMSKKYEFDEKYSDAARRHSFTAENVKVGSVIEVTYKFSSPRYYDIDDIELQLAIPVNQTKVVVGYAEYFLMNRTQRGYVHTRYKRDSHPQTLTLSAYETLSYQLHQDYYEAEDVPALPEEDYSFCPTQYRGSLIYDLSGLYIPGSLDRSFAQKWTDVDKAVAESDILKVSQERFRESKELEAALQGVEGDEAKIVAVRDYLMKKVKWNEKSMLVPDTGKEVLKAGSGSDADINALMASALNAVGFQAEPVLVKRRSSGILMEFHISLNTFDTFILRVVNADGTGTWYLDAARESGYLNVLNPDFIVEKARLVHANGSGEWVDLTGLTKSRVNELVKAGLSPEGVLTGSVQIQAYQEESYSLKSHYDSFDSEDAFLDDIEADENIEVTEFEIQKEYGPVTSLKYSFEKDDETGERIYLHPFLSTFHSASAFRKEKRIIPVDFPYPENIIYNYSLTIPEGYVVEELPESKSITCPPVGGRILFQCREVGNQVSVSYRFSLESTIVVPEKYADLRVFWETATGVEKSTIVLKKQ